MAASGLSSAEAAERLRTHGPNVAVPPPRGGFLRELAGSLADPMALLLIIGAVVYWLLGDHRDSIVLAVALIPVLAVDVVLELRSRKALEALARAVASRARVVRDGKAVLVESREVVPGDLLLLSEGDVVHADGAVLSATNLALDESTLTGEAEPVSKHSTAGDGGRVFAGSTVLTGSGTVSIDATGPLTRIGKVAALVGEATEPATPLERRIRGLVLRLALAASGVAVLVGLLALARGEGLNTALISAIGLAMAAAPEEFPLVFTLYLSLGAWRLGRKGVLVRRLTAAETLGSTTVICVDKTGTLTAGRFRLETVLPLDGANASTLLETAVLASEKDPADPMEQAIVATARERGALSNGSTRIVRDHDFDPVGKHMTHVYATELGGRVAAKGSLEGILEHCRLDPARRQEAEAANERLASQGERVLAVAERIDAGPPSPSGSRDEDERDLTLVGLLGFADPLRSEVPAAVREARQAGVEVKLLTGDHALTATAIAQAAGIPVGPHLVASGADLAREDAASFARKVRQVTVIARLQPEQKHAVVAALQEAGEVVAMTGDGVNDAPALRRADIGISMGPRATEVARAAADLVLLEDRFSALVEAVKEGRALFGNLQRAFLFLLAFHVPIVGLALIAPLLGIPLILLPVHLVWLELIIHPVSALVFEGIPPTAETMARPPRPRSAPLLGLRPSALAVLAGLLLTAAALALDLWLLRQGASAEQARAGALITVVLGAAFLALFDGAGVSGRRRDWITLGVVLASAPLAIQFPPLADVLDLRPPGPTGWLAGAALALLAVGWRALPFRFVRAGVDGRATLGIVALLLAAILPAGFLLAPSTVDGPVLFSISKTQNANQVLYAVRLDSDCRPLGDAPVHAWWAMLEEGAGAREPLLGIEERAYGIAQQRVLERRARSGTVELTLRPTPGRLLTVETGPVNGSCRAEALTRIAGRPARLLHVEARTIGWFSADYIVLSGVALDDGALLSERVPR